MKGKAIIPLALGLCVGLVAVKFLVDAVKKAQGSQNDQKMISVVKTKIDLDLYQLIKEEMVELVRVPDNPLIPLTDRVADIEDIVGRVTSKSIPMGAPILQSMLAPPGTPAGMVGRIPEGFRAVSVKIDEVTGVAYQISPGDWVDVIVVMDLEKQRRERETIAEVILQNVQVAAIGQDSAAQAAAASSGVKAKPAKSATLFVKQDDVPKLHLAQSRGKITLAMRGDDNSVTAMNTIVRDKDAFEALREDEVEDDETTPQPVKQIEPKQTIVEPDPVEPPPPHSVVVTRGTTEGNSPKPEIERITFENSESANIISVSSGAAGTGAYRFAGANRRGNRRPADRVPRPVPEEEKEFDRYEAEGE